MSISELSVKRKVAMTAFLIMLLFLGLKMYKSIGIDSLPKFDIPYVLITAVYPGASPEEIEVEVAKRLEDAVASLDGLKRTMCVCMENACALQLEFVLGTDVDIMIHEVREKINTVVSDFPDAVRTPTLSKININAVPVVTLFLSGNKSVDELYDYADQTLANTFASIPGVGEIRVHGGDDTQLHIIADPAKLAESGLTLAQIINRISTSNLKLPAGHVQQDGHEMTVTYDAEFRDIQAIKELEISSANGKRIYLGDIADIRLQAKEMRQLAFIDGKPAVQIEVVKRSDANAVNVINEAQKRFDNMLADGTLPSGMELHWFRDTGDFIHASVKDAWSSIFLGIALTAVLLLLFLHDIRSTFIAVISMPTSIIVSFIAMKALNYTFDLMTLVSLGCASGVLVTNAVVVLENIFKRMESGLNARMASIKGTGEVIVAVAASALTNVVVFVPVALMTSVVGMVIGPFAGVMVVSTMASLFISFTLTPILASLFFAHGKREQGAISRAVFKIWDVCYAKLESSFGGLMDFTHRHSTLVILICLAAAVALSVIALPHISLEFFPNNDKGEITVTLEYPVNTALPEATRRTLEYANEFRKSPYVTAVGTTVGYVNSIPGKVSEGVYLGEISINLLPKGQRPGIFTITDEIRKRMAPEENLLCSVNVTNPIGSAGADINMFIAGPDYNEVLKYLHQSEQCLLDAGIASDMDTSIRPQKGRVNIRPDRTVLRNLGISETALSATVIGSFDGVEAGTYKVGDRSYDIRVKTADSQGFQEVRNINIGSMKGYPAAITTLANLENAPASVSIMRVDKQRSAWLYCNPANGAALGDVMNTLQKEIGSKLPAGYSLNFFGMADMMESGVEEFVDTFIIAIVLTYLLIAALMESWLGPFLIMFTVPLGFVGMIFTLYLSHTPMSMVSLLGGVMMIGIVVNNAILIMDETTTLIRTGMTRHQAMLAAVKSKFRPVVMTSIASVCGMIPMAFGTGLGSELRSSCGIGVIGGLTYSAIMTLFLIPALYFQFTKDKHATIIQDNIPEQTP